MTSASEERDVIDPFLIEGIRRGDEATVNEVLNRGKTPTVCVYDVRRLSGSLVVDLLRAHPVTVMNGVLQKNPFYTPADKLLEDLQRRRTQS